MPLFGQLGVAGLRPLPAHSVGRKGNFTQEKCEIFRIYGPEKRRGNLNIGIAQSVIVDGNVTTPRLYFKTVHESFQLTRLLVDMMVC